MNYLQKLKADKEAREQYEIDQKKLKEAINKINELHTAYDGFFIQSLQKFLRNFETLEKQKQQEINNINQTQIIFENEQEI